MPFPYHNPRRALPILWTAIKRPNQWRRLRMSFQRQARCGRFARLFAVAVAVPTIILSLWSGANIAEASGANNATAIAGARRQRRRPAAVLVQRLRRRPTVNHRAGSGVYYLKFPGAPILGQNSGGNSVLEVTPDTPSADCTAANADYANAGAATVIAVETKDCTNVFADRGFHLVVFGAPPATTGANNATAIAGARVNAAGQLLYWFNDFGGAPTVNHRAGSGVYYLKFPGAPILGQNSGGNSVLEVTPDTPSADCTAANADYANAGAATVIAVETKDCTNVFADRGFHLVVFGAPPATTGANNATAIAGARVNAAGQLLYWFNDFGGAPTVNHRAGSGVYYLKFPGAPILGQNSGGNSVLEVTPDTPSADCTAANADYANAGAATVIAVETKDCTNVFADRGFHLVVFGADT